MIGEARAARASIKLNLGRERISIQVRNTSVHAVRVSSHYPFWLSNPRLAFDRDAAHGFRLDVPSGASVRWAPGATKQVGLVRLGGASG
ncbi:MAG TPA: urease subunit beta [Actinomycetota bacterium]|nr:urease subunit beta [Actinomycetota bacterium]